MKKFFICLPLMALLTGCSQNKRVATHQTSTLSSESPVEHRFTIKQDSPQQKITMNEIKDDYQNHNLSIDIHSFNDGYSVHLKNQSLLQDIRDNDKNGFLKSVIIPVTQEVSMQTHSKIYFNADDPNMELIVTANNGKLEYTINLSN
ncbi:MAG: hypothetical protein IAA89_00980 [Firmicutes bacterium]|uniref:Lipoprotein n=1 Tax=Candidatus Gallilactobacillus intestinavium TaxID=2840838 RepID=A0A9D9E4Y7_9LACO|nr:hypothetical protein [Candidatus Gallilactobacillus intestinavium]